MSSVDVATGVVARERLQQRTLASLRMAQIPGQAAVAGSVSRSLPGDRLVHHYALSWMAVVTCPKRSAAYLDAWLGAVCAADLAVLVAAAALAVRRCGGWKFGEKSFVTNDW